MEVMMTKTIISHIQEGSIGMKKNRTDVTRQMRADKVKAFFFEHSLEIPIVVRGVSYNAEFVLVI